MEKERSKVVQSESVARVRDWIRLCFPSGLNAILRSKAEKTGKGSHQKGHESAATVDKSNARFTSERGKGPSPVSISTFGWLSTVSLSMITGLFMTLGFALLLVWHYNIVGNGYALVTDNHYSWTYGPTAILVFVVALWRQVDFNFKSAAPWLVLQHGHANGKDTLLLDYISPLQPTSFWRALRNRQFGVLSTITGFVLLKVITLASTGLFVADLTQLSSQSIGLIRNVNFNGSLWNITQPLGSEDASVVYEAYGVLARGVATHGFGTTNDLAYETFKIPPDLQQKSGRLVAQMNAFIPDFNCVDATVSINPSPYGTDGEQSGQTISILSPGCQLMGGAQPVFVLDANTELCPQTQFRGNMERVNCSRMGSSVDLRNYQLLTLAEISYQQVLNNSATNTTTAVDSSDIDVVSWTIAINQTKSLLCRPAYSMGKVNVTYDFSEDPPLITVGAPTVTNGHLAGFQDDDLASRFTSSLVAGANMFGDITPESDLEQDFPNTMFSLMASAAGGDGQYQSLMDGNAMKDAAEQTYRQMAVQFASKYLLEPDGSEFNGDLTSVENRLKVNPLSLWIMLGGFAVMAVLASAVFFLRPRKPLPPYSHTAYGMALVLDQNPNFQSLIETLLDLKETEIALKLAEYKFSAFATEDSIGASTTVVECFPNGNSPRSLDLDATEALPDPNQMQWWNPLPTRRFIVVVVVLLLITTIAALEALQRLSDSNRGVLTLPAIDTTTTTVYTRLLPALVILILATSVNAIDFNVMVLAPFSAMKSGRALAEASMELSLVDQLPPLALWKAIKHRHFATVCSSTAAIIGSILTIVVSGLYTPRAIPGTTAIALKASDAFNTSWPESATNDSTAALIVSLTESLNSSYPAFTYNELALPTFAMPEIPSNMTASTLEVTYPAVRASLNCSTLSSESFNFSADYDPRIETSSANVNVIVPLPPNCLLGGPGGNLSYINVAYRAGLQANASYFGKVLDLHVGPYDAIQGSAFGETDPGSQPDNPPGCPSLAFIYGYADITTMDRSDVTVLMCYQEMQRVRTSVTFDLPALSISTTQPPVPDEASVELLPAGVHGETAFSYRIEQHMDQSLSLFNQTQYSSANLAESPVDGFFQAVLFGKTPLPESMLVGQENRATVFQGINAFYRRYMAQAISSNMRVPSPASAATNEAQTYAGFVSNASLSVRLVQHNGAKLALQALLGLMAILTALACMLTKLDKVVPYNPCTIFGVAALLAGSRLCRDRRLETLKQDEDTTCYRLGWWDDAPDELTERAVFGVAQGSTRERRYGIDFVEPEQRV
ncbi:hypothetical protein AYL99_04139 [Fonsecaea erecta]|uniref:Uncharacterized protein n=1 Tax=Fonsecaea erecta TaxID=1367422 RepID=A0A178ZRE3_9EURO|nr:hypothetical protein AYL99_04139 [Fonsecaea erecta]OAP61936.1 hypothetical protein AYL99_04139 [Fonsecaea erecta]